MSHLIELLADNEHLYKQVARYKILETLIKQLLKDIGNLKYTELKDMDSLKKIEEWLRK